MNENNIPEMVRRAAEKSGFVREKYVESRLPTTASHIVAIPYFGDRKHEFVLATMILNRMKEAEPHKYFIVCGWPGHAGLFSVADEYWGIKDEGAMKTLLSNTDGFGNTDQKSLFFERQLNRYFETISAEDLSKFYNNGLTSYFFDKFRFVTLNLHTQTSVKSDFGKLMSSKKGRKVYIHPTRHARAWRRGKVSDLSINPNFWDGLVEAMVSEEMVPVVQQDASTWDLSVKHADKCLFVPQYKLLDQMGVMRNSGCVLNVFSDISKFAIAARAPFVTLTERELYNQTKEYELDDLCAVGLPHSYIFSFATMIGGGDYINLVDIILAKLKNFLPTVDPNKLPSTAESSVVAPYMLVKEHKAKKFGTKFFKIQKI